MTNGFKKTFFAKKAHFNNPVLFCVIFPICQFLVKSIGFYYFIFIQHGNRQQSSNKTVLQENNTKDPMWPHPNIVIVWSQQPFPVILNFLVKTQRLFFIPDFADGITFYMTGRSIWLSSRHVLKDHDTEVWVTLRLVGFTNIKLTGLNSVMAVLLMTPTKSVAPFRVLYLCFSIMDMKIKWPPPPPCVFLPLPSMQHQTLLWLLEHAMCRHVPWAQLPAGLRPLIQSSCRAQIFFLRY